MKKFILFTLLTFTALIVGLIVLYCFYSCSTVEEIIVKIATMMIESLLAGAVTFGGLFFTFMFQERQVKVKDENEACPLFVIEATNNPTAEDNVHIDKDVNEVCDGKNSDKVRKINCTVKNVKGNYALNAELIMNNSNEKIKIGNNMALRFCLLSSGEHSLFFRFEDIYGRKYKQEVTYEYIRNNYNFTYKKTLKEKEE